MPNVASVLKGEMSRVARREVRGETLALKKAVSHYRTEIAALPVLEDQPQRPRKPVRTAFWARLR